MATLSLCMIVKDEERFLQECLDSAKAIVDELIIVDTGSSDGTKEIAEAAGAKVFDFRWKDDFAEARNFSLEKANCNWILVLDADEVLDEAGRSDILKLINTKEHCLSPIVGFKLDQRTYKPKPDVEMKKTVDPSELRSIYESHESSELVRLFSNNPKICFRNRIHELVEHSIRENDGSVVDTSVVLHHFSALKGDTVHQKKLKKYTSLIWEQLEKEPTNPRYNHQAARAFIEAGRKDLALKYFLRTLKLDPDRKGILADIAKVHLELGDVKKAVKFFNFAVAKDRKDASSLNNLGVIYMNLRKLDVAQKLFETALGIDPENKAVSSNMEKLKSISGRSPV